MNTFALHKKAKESDAALALNAALRYLSRREYTKLELYKKLYLRYTSEAAKCAVKKCVENGWLSEERYVEMLHRHIINQHYGPRKFVLEAQKKGLKSNLYADLIDNTDWTEVAVAFLTKKIPDKNSLTFESKQKILAALARRGFTNSTCIEALEEYLSTSYDS